MKDDLLSGFYLDGKVGAANKKIEPSFFDDKYFYAMKKKNQHCDEVSTTDPEPVKAISIIV